MAEPIVIMERFHRLNSYTFYPRVNHFKKRLDSLMPRFCSLVDSFKENFQDLGWREKINETYQWLSHPLVVMAMGSDKFSRDRFVVHDVDEWADLPEADMVLTSDMTGLCITVCYIKVDDTTDKGKEIVQKVIEHACLFLKRYSYSKTKSDDTHDSTDKQLSDDDDHVMSIQNIDDKDLFKSLFIFCEVTVQCSEIEIASFRKYINECVREKSDTWSGSKRIVMGPDQVTLGSLISEHVERTIMQVFWYIYEYLCRFTCGRQPQMDGTDIAFSDEVETELYAFVRSDNHLADIKRQVGDANLKVPGDTRTVEAMFFDYIVDHLIKILKCVALKSLALKTGLKIQICDLCLNVIRFDKIAKKHLSQNKNKSMKRIHSFCENYLYEDIRIKTKEESKKGIERKTHSDNDDMVTYLKNDFSAVFSEVEKELMKAFRQISIMEKMKYEIEGYFRIAGTPVEPLPVKTPSELLKDLIRIPGVVGAGTIYNKLEVHIKKSDEHLQPTKLEIEDTIRRHKYTKPYVMRRVLKEAHQLASVQHEQGTLIKSEIPGRAIFRHGTLGIFAEAEETLETDGQKSGSKKLFALTCAHVVNPYDNPELPVLVVGNAANWTVFGVSKPELTVNIGMEDSARLIDIAAVQVVENLQRDCLRYVKDEDGFPKTSFIKNCNFVDLAGQIVYKIGAKSGYTMGLVCSGEYLTTMNANVYADYVVVIDRLPGTNRDFAKPGDSGSIVCMPAITTEDQFCGSVAVVAMVNAGELQLEGFESTHTFGFLFHQGIDILSRRSGLQLRTT